MKPNRFGSMIIAVVLIVAALALAGCNPPQPTQDIEATVAEATVKTEEAKPSNKYTRSPYLVQ